MHLNGSGRGRLVQQPDDDIGVADTGQTPGANDAFLHQPREQWPYMVDEHGIGRHAAVGVGPASEVGRVRHHI